MKFITYITNKINKASKAQSDMVWSRTSISSKELFFFNKGLQTLDLDMYVRGRGEKKNYEVDGYKFEFGVHEYTLEGYTKVETPEGLIFEVKDLKYKNQRSVEVRFYVGE